MMLKRYRCDGKGWAIVKVRMGERWWCWEVGVNFAVQRGSCMLGVGCLGSDLFVRCCRRKEDVQEEGAYV